MKKAILLVLAALFVGANASFASVTAANAPVVAISKSADVKALPTDISRLNVEDFLSLTPAKYKEMTGEKLGWKKSLALKAAQKAVKKEMGKGGTDLPKGAYVVLVLIGWGFLAMGLMDDWQGNNWWVNLLLTFLCWLPGVIHGLIKMKDYYK